MLDDAGGQRSDPCRNLEVTRKLAKLLDKNTTLEKISQNCDFSEFSLECEVLHGGIDIFLCSIGSLHKRFHPCRDLK